MTALSALTLLGGGFCAGWILRTVVVRRRVRLRVRRIIEGNR